MRAGQDLVCVGYVGTRGTLRIMEDKRGELEKCFSRAYLDAAAIQAAGNLACPPELGESVPVGRGGILAALWNFCSGSVQPERMAVDEQAGSCFYKGLELPQSECAADGEQTGNFVNNAWKRLQAECAASGRQGEKPHSAAFKGLGCEYRLDCIPVLQATVELCEEYGLNPYRLWSENCWLAAADNGGQLAQRLRAQGFAAEVIGVLTDGRARVRVDGEEPAYLTREQRDELEKLLGKRNMVTVQPCKN